MKAAVNGALNLSILDGWWDEAVRDNPKLDIGWAIGNGEEYKEAEAEYQDEIESRALFNLLEKEVVPLFYDRSSGGIPHGWTDRMKASMETLCPTFNTNRMVCDYTERFYHPAENRWRDITADDYKKVRGLAEWKTKIGQEWHKLRITSVECENINELPVGKQLHVHATVNLGGLSPGDVAVEIFHGRLNSSGEIVAGTPVQMMFVSHASDAVFDGDVPAAGSGQHGFAIRVLPFHVDLVNPFSLGLITWSQESAL
jgi:starch phosphorylase